MKFSSGIILPQLPRNDKGVISWASGIHKALHQLISNITRVLSRAIIYDDVGNVGIGTDNPGSKLAVVGLPTYADNTAALADGLVAGDFYRTSTGSLMVTY